MTNIHADSPRFVIISRHAGGVQWVRETDPRFKEAKVIDGNATPDDVSGAVVAGNLPLHLACQAREYNAIEFNGAPPRGTEYGSEEMRQAGARLVRYFVRTVAQEEELHFQYQLE
jgi:putative CRISPR-associated protein (TIGR02620 family)